MGLGKTVQVAAAADFVHAQTMVVICPAQVKIHWARTLLEWRDLKPQHICILRTGKCTIPANARVVIVNYELAVKPKVHNQLIARGGVRPFDVCVIDEAHYLKNPAAKRTKRLLGKSSFLHFCRYKWCLTGTPILNRPAEFYPLLRTMAPETIDPYLSMHAFGVQFCNGRRTVDGQWDYSGYSHLTDLAERIKPYMLRRKKEDVLDQLPDIVRTPVNLDVTPPSTLDDTHIATVRRELAIAKIGAASEFITDLLTEVPKIVVFSHHRAVIEGLADSLRDYGPVICYGGLNAEQKQKAIDNFVNNPTTQVFIAQTVAGGIGIDGLQLACNNVVFMESDWSPGIMDQAVDRLRRIGQKDTVFVYDLVVGNSLDEQISNTVKSKRNIINRVVLTSEVTQYMSTPSFDSIPAFLERIAVALEARVVVPAASAADSPAPQEKPKAEKPEKPAPKPKAEKPLPPSDPVPNVDEIGLRNAVGEFINFEGEKERNKRILTEILWPKYSVENLADLCSPKNAKKWDDVMAELSKNPTAFIEQGDSADDYADV